MSQPALNKDDSIYLPQKYLYFSGTNDVIPALLQQQISSNEDPTVECQNIGS